jgi:hypothetical protein
MRQLQLFALEAKVIIFPKSTVGRPNAEAMFALR